MTIAHDTTGSTASPLSRGGAPPSPRLVFFGVPGRRDLAQRAAAASPGARFSPRRHWMEDPGEPHRPLLGGEAPAGLWYWKGTAEEFEAQAGAILLRLVHPLLARGLPYCLGFPFGPEVLAPRRLGVDGAAALDLEDIGRLLGAGQATPGPAVAGGANPPGSAGSPSGPPLPARAAARPPDGPDAVRLDDAQRAAVLHAVGPARVLAPAGSGKTKTLISRVVELVDRGCDPSGFLMLAFNRKAAEQLEERLAALGIASTRRLGAPAEGGPGAAGPSRRRRRSGPSAVPERPAGVHCATFNAFGYRYQREVMRARIMLDHDGRALRDLMARAMRSAGVSLAELKPRRGSDPVGAFMRGLTGVRAALEPPDAVEVTLECLTDTPLVTLPFGPTHAQYTRAQAATGLQSFDDQIYFAVADMLADPAHRAFVQQRFDHVFVDEFQDLNGSQLALVDLLSRPDRRLFVVGDDDQLIYGWRQADPRGILEFHARMPPKPFSATYTLCTNYRCSRAVVETGARLVAHNEIREAKEIRPRAGAQDGAVRFFGAPSWPERAAAVREFLRAEKARLECDWRDLAVLCRYRSQQFLVALALDAGDIPRTPALGCTLFTHPAAHLLRSYLDLTQTPDDVPAPVLAELLNRPNRFVPRAAVEVVAGAARPWAHVCKAAAKEPPAGPRPLSGLVELVTTLRTQVLPPADEQHEPEARPLTSEDLVWMVVETFGLDDHWAAEADAAAASGAASDGAGPLEVFDALLLLAETYPEPQAFRRTWDRLRADEEAQEGVADDTLAREESDDDRVVIGTIHAAKGREYHSVAIPDYDCDVSRWEQPEVEEERRVIYVGVTRARDAVLFTVDTSTGFVHPFLRELVEPPEPQEHESLCVWLEEETGPGASPIDAPPAETSPNQTSAGITRLIADRLAEIEVLYPELVPQVSAATAAAAAPAAPRSASPSAPCPASDSATRPPATPGR
jgi:DNA helicase-2/ATP-dependent DNA helicase PcrA